MPIVIDDILINITLSTLFSRYFSLILNGSSSPDSIRQNLEQFLNILSKDFSAKAEQAIRDALLENNFDDVKANTLSAVRFITEYGHSITPSNPQGDLTALGHASQAITAAASKYKVIHDKILSVPLPAKYSLYEKPDIREARIKLVPFSQKQIEVAFFALKSIAALDLLILSKRTQLYSGLVETIKLRVDEYIGFVNQLISFALSLQSLRVKYANIGFFEKDRVPLKVVYDNNETVSGFFTITESVFNEAKQNIKLGGTASLTFSGPPTKNTEFPAEIKAGPKWILNGNNTLPMLEKALLNSSAERVSTILTDIARDSGISQESKAIINLWQEVRKEIVSAAIPAVAVTPQVVVQQAADVKSTPPVSSTQLGK